MNLLLTVQEFCRRQALSVPLSVFGSFDPQVAQLYSLLQEGADEVAQRGRWQRLVYEATWSSLATEDQGALSTLATNGFDYLLPETLWDRTQQINLLGPLDPQQWQAVKATVMQGPVYNFRIRGGHLLVNPAPPAGHTWAFEYKSQNWILAVDGVTYKRIFTADTDDILLPDKITLADLRWRWKKEKGLAYAEDFKSCEDMIQNMLGRDGAKPTLCLDRTYESVRPGVFMPAGSWLQP
jgi:hypothetical protein